ncbi:SET domain-containing protein-lysine N-methyltransferase [Gemmatimonas sp.]|uniref:SET domain-containing protein-lysine N-methyltransferase n=1 Tax=Gemmatimonas sp. TaxID=1962908 RepID=UPI003566483A
MPVPTSDIAIVDAPTDIHARSKVAVVRFDRSFHLMATTLVTGGEVIVSIDGIDARRPSFTSVQIDTDRHIEIDTTLDVLEQIDEYPWRFLNHSCEPNTIIRGRDVVALRLIGHGDELTFNYNTTEFDMAEPFACHCGSLFCLGTVRGFRHLSPKDRDRLRPLLAPHLAAHHDGVPW